MQIHVDQPFSVFRFSHASHEPGISDRKAGPISVIDVKGPLVGRFAVQDLNGRVWQLLNDRARELAINLNGVTDIDSSGLGGLAEAYNQVKSRGGEIRFFGVPKRVGRLLRRMHLDTIFELHPTERSALTSFGGSGGRQASGSDR